MKFTERFVVLFFSVICVIAIMFSAACAPALTVAPESELTPAATTTLIATSSPMPTTTPEPTLSLEEDKTAKLDQDFQNFLNKEGDFTPEKVFPMLIEFYCSHGNSTREEDWSSYDKRGFGLGFASISPHIQGYLFDYFENERRVVLILGFDGADGARFITPVEIPFYVVEDAQRHFGVNKSSVNNMDGIDYSNIRDTVSTGECFESIVIIDRNTLFSILDSLIGKVIAIYLETNEWDFDLSKNATYQSMDPKAQNCLIEYQKELNPKVDLAFALLNSVSDNDIKINEWHGGDEQEIYRRIMNADGSTILKIENADNLEDIDISKVPLLGYFLWFAGNSQTP